MKNLQEQNPPIRVSTGWGFANDFPPLQHQILANITDGVELSLTATNRFSFYIENPINSPSISVHLSSPIPEEHKEPLQSIVSEYDDIQGFVMHPRKDIDSVKQSINKSKISDSIMMENLDSKTGTESSEQILNDCLDLLSDSKMTIDLQHLSEQYTTENAIDFIHAHKEYVQQFHVSGRTDDNLHELLIHNPRNQDEIETMLEHISSDSQLSRIPLVIEGKYTSVSEVREEYEYLKQIYK